MLRTSNPLIATAIVAALLATTTANAASGDADFNRLAGSLATGERPWVNSLAPEAAVDYLAAAESESADVLFVQEKAEGGRSAKGDKPHTHAKSGTVVLAQGVALPAGTASYEGDLYDSIRMTSDATARGAAGPIRSAEGTQTGRFEQRYEGDMYDHFRLPPQELKGALGPVRTSASGDEDSLWKALQRRAPILGGGNG